MTTTWVPVAGGVLAAGVEGSGDAVLVVQTALSVDELVPLIRRLGDRYRVITFDRRGYGSSAGVGGAASVDTDAQDCLAVLGALEDGPVHVVGVSYSAAVALGLAELAPAAVRSLTLVEPPPRHVPASAEFLAATRHLMGLHQRQGVAVALDAFMGMLVGPDWRPRQEVLAPGSVARIERDADAFFSRDIPALVSWAYGPEQAARVNVPVLYVGGTESGPWFRQTQAWVSDLFPAAQSVTIEGAGHDLALTHPGELANVVARFLDTQR
ncbi:alpha/beta fold hydrolase [Tessaracoccus sp. G1721]